MVVLIILVILSREGRRSPPKALRTARFQAMSLQYVHRLHSSPAPVCPGRNLHERARSDISSLRRITIVICICLNGKQDSMKTTLLGQVLFWSLLLHQVFAILLLLARPEDRKDHSLAIALFFACNIITSLPQVPEMLGHAPLAPGVDTIAVPFLMLLGPSIYFYCRALVSPDVLHLKRSDVWHVAPFVVAVIVALELLILLIKVPAVDANTALLATSDSNWTTRVTVGFSVLLLLLFVGTTSFYVIRSLRLLARYRRTRFDYFSSDEGRNLSWIEIMMGVMSFAWLINIAMLADDFSFKSLTVFHNFAIIVEASWVYALSFLVLWQKAVFTPAHTQFATQDEEDPSAPSKYQRSALDDERRSRIAAKIEMAMERDKLYRNQNVTLRNLSDHTRISENYLSQVLNETLAKNFYEFINHWRIKEACSLLLAGAGSIIDIGEQVGFNSRSTFNAAFKKETGLTPSEYRTTRQLSEPAKQNAC